MNMFCAESGTDPSEGGGEDRARLTSPKGISVNKQTHQSAISRDAQNCLEQCEC